MNAHDTAAAASILDRALKAIRSTLVQEGDQWLSVDPVFPGLRRNRVNAEAIKAALNLSRANRTRLGFDDEVVLGLGWRLVRTQAAEGCWNEIHPGYDAPGAMATAFMGEALVALLGADLVPRAEAHTFRNSIKRAAAFVLAAEMRPGFFQKSRDFQADHLNADVACGAFLAAAGDMLAAPELTQAAERAARHVVREQFENGSFPYTTKDKGAPYPTPLNVPCIHYQGVTAYYLAKINDKQPSPEIQLSLAKAADWLSGVRGKDGAFDWAASKLMFAQHLSAAHAFAIALFSLSSAHDRNIADSLTQLDRAVPGLAWRWEPGRRRPVRTALRSAWTPGFPLRERAFRLAYGWHRQHARARLATKIHQGAYRFATGLLGIKSGSVEASRNFPDLFMTSEIADCLAWAIVRSPVQTQTSKAPAMPGGRSR